MRVHSCFTSAIAIEPVNDRRVSFAMTLPVTAKADTVFPQQKFSFFSNIFYEACKIKPAPLSLWFYRFNDTT